MPASISAIEAALEITLQTTTILCVAEDYFLDIKRGNAWQALLAQDLYTYHAAEETDDSIIFEIKRLTVYM